MSSLAKKIDTKTWVIIGLGGVTVVAGFALFSQWKHATLGRKVRRSVVRFLKDHGSVVQNGIVTGGVVQQPLKIDTAVNATVVQMLNGVADQMEGGAGGMGPVDPDGGAPMMPNPTTAMDGYQTYASMPPPRVRAKRQQAPVGSAKRGGSARNPPSPRAMRKAQAPRSGATPASPLEISKQFRDDGGYADSSRRGGRQRSGESFEYNPNDLVPKGRAPQRKSVFTDDEGDDDGAVGPVDDDDDDDYE